MPPAILCFFFSWICFFIALKCKYICALFGVKNSNGRCKKPGNREEEIIVGDGRKVGWESKSSVRAKIQRLQLTELEKRGFTNHRMELKL